MVLTEDRCARFQDRQGADLVGGTPIGEMRTRTWVTSFEDTSVAPRSNRATCGIASEDHPKPPCGGAGTSSHRAKRRLAIAVRHRHDTEPHPRGIRKQSMSERAIRQIEPRRCASCRQPAAREQFAQRPMDDLKQPQAAFRCCVR